VKTLLTIITFLLIFQICNAQQDRKGIKIIHLSAGATFANLLNSEAPHKLNVYGSDIQPALFYPDVTRSLGYFDYSTHIIKDIRTGLVLKAGIEYFLKNNWSVVTSIAYEEKGIDLDFRHASHRDVTTSYEPGNNIGGGPPSFYVAHYDQYYQVKINNSYLTVPIIIKKYFSSQKFYLSAGGFAAWLTESDVHTFQRKHHYSPDYRGYESDYVATKHLTDKKKEFTNHMDYGLAVGTGFACPLSTNLQINLDLLVSAGLRKVDRKYNNEYEEDARPATTGYMLMVRSTNYYGLNSDATNVSAAFTFGVGYKLP
jgi:hypothetical protein